jgi:hypothetical protein
MNKPGYRLVLTAALLISMIASSRPTIASHVNSYPTNTPNQIAAPSTLYPLLYTINASNALLVKDKDEHLHLTLKGVHHNLSYKSNTMPGQKTNGIQTINGFVKKWQAKKENPSVEADVTGVQINHKTFGHTEFYAKVLLSNPTYDAKKKELRFDVVSNSPLTIDGSAKFHNPMIFINGCSLCDCEKTVSACDVLVLGS